MWHTPVLPEMTPFGGIAILLIVLAMTCLAEPFYNRPVRRWIVRKLRRRSPPRQERPRAVRAS